MASNIQNHPKNAQYSLFHQGIIKVFVIHELNKTWTTWEQFLVVSKFETLKTMKTKAPINSLA